MRIGLTHPTCWPQVRRGAERFLAELGQYLRTRGHSVTTISSAAQASRSSELILKRQLLDDPAPSARIQPWHEFLFTSFAELTRHRFDVVQSLHYADAVAAQAARRATDHRALYYLTGPPIPAALRRVPPDRWLVRRAIEHADMVLVPSAYIAGVVAEHYRAEVRIVPVPVDTNRFQPRTSADDRQHSPRHFILAVAAFDDLRKGLRPLVKAFHLIHGDEPEMSLVVSGRVSDALRTSVLKGIPQAVANKVVFAGTGEPDDLPRLYAAASLTVIPAKWESYSLVALEAWACGCPVLAAAHGALPELVGDDGTGLLFEPGGEAVEVQNVDGLAEGILRGLRLSRLPETRELCRRKALRYSWSAAGPAFEQVYQEVLDR